MLKVTHYQFSTDGKWHSTIVPTLVSDPTLIATETASSRATGKVYGQFYNNALSGFEFGVIDYDAMERTTIAESQHKYVALGVTSYEAVYGVATDGNLYRIDTETGEERLVGPTGVSVAESSRELRRAVRSIRTTTSSTGPASTRTSMQLSTPSILLRVLPPSSQTCPTTSRSLAWASPDATPPAAAPAAVADFRIAFDGGSTSGTVSFTAPTKTYGGASLSGSVSYTVKANQRTIASARPRPASRSAHP